MSKSAIASSFQLWEILKVHLGNSQPEVRCKDEYNNAQTQVIDIGQDRTWDQNTGKDLTANKLWQTDFLIPSEHYTGGNLLKLQKIFG